VSSDNFIPPPLRTVSLMPHRCAGHYYDFSKFLNPASSSGYHFGYTSIRTSRRSDTQSHPLCQSQETSSAPRANFSTLQNTGGRKSRVTFNLRVMSSLRIQRKSLGFTAHFLRTASRAMSGQIGLGQYGSVTGFFNYGANIKTALLKFCVMLSSQ
jgi:hypothetical protein